MQSVAPMEKTVSQSTFKHANPILDKKKLSPEEKRENCGILFQKRSVVSIKVSRAYLNAKHASTRRTNARKGIIIRVKKRKIGFWEKEKKDERSFPKRKITCNLSLWWKRTFHACECYTARYREKLLSEENKLCQKENCRAFLDQKGSYLQTVDQTNEHRDIQMRNARSACQRRSQNAALLVKIVRKKTSFKRATASFNLYDPINARGSLIYTRVSARRVFAGGVAATRIDGNKSFELRAKDFFQRLYDCCSRLARDPDIISQSLNFNHRLGPFVQTIEY